MKWTQEKLKLNLPGKTWKLGALSPNREAHNITEQGTGAHRYPNTHFPDVSNAVYARYSVLKDVSALMQMVTFRRMFFGAKVVASVLVNVPLV